MIGRVARRTLVRRIGRGVWRVLSSRTGIVLAVLGVAWAWHEREVAVAVTAAREGFVQEIELEAARAEAEAIQRTLDAARRVNSALQVQVAASEEEAARIQAELEAYENETEINPNGVVDRALLELLRAN